VVGLPENLIFEEFQVRMHAGDTIEPDEILRRFPQHAPKLVNLLGSMAVPGSPIAEYEITDVKPVDSEEIATSGWPQASKPSGPSATFANEKERNRAALQELNALEEGESIDDFDLLLVLGRGAFARVFLARQRSMERLVALKITIDRSSEPQTLARMDHPNIVHVFDQRPWGRAGLRLLYMELVGGGTLQAVIRLIGVFESHERHGGLVLELVDRRLAANGIAPPEGSHLRQALAESDWPQAVCHLGRRLADGLAYAHSKDVLHRDIKPANVLLTSEGSPKLVDFNISFNASRETESPEDRFGGTLIYMSPEQLAAWHPLLEGSPHQVREASDIYSLGVVLYELTTGHRPFEDTNQGKTRAVDIQRMIDLRTDTESAKQKLEASLEEAAPEPLRQVLLRCLRPRPADRYRTAGRLAEALRLCLHPRCWKLLQAPTGWLGKVAIGYPVAVIMLATLLPNLLVAILNLLYNLDTILPAFSSAGNAMFMKTQAAINGIAFPVGLGVVFAVSRKATKQLRAPPTENLEPGGADLLFLGRFIAKLAVSLWCIAALAYPLTLHMSVTGGNWIELYLHFLISLTLCGLLAATYPFFLITFLTVRWWIPTLLRREVSLGPSHQAFEELHALMRTFLVMAALVPLLSILMTLLRYEQHRVFLIIFTVSGLGFVAIYYLLYRPTEEDLNAIADFASGRRG